MNATTAPAPRAQSPAEIGKRKLSDLKSLFDSMAPQLQTALPKHMKADRLARIALTACHRTPGLLECTPKSFAAALMTAAQIGLEPDGVIGQAYLIPRKNNGVKEVCLQVGYKGLVELAQRSGRIASISCRVVREGDDFAYSFGLDDELKHRPTGDPEAPITHVYAVARTTDGGRYAEVMTTSQVEAHRRRFAKDSRADSAWNTSWDWMAKKTVLIQALKLAPKSVELAHAVAVDEEPETIVPADAAVLDLSPEPDTPAAPTSGLAGITARAEAKKGSPIATSAGVPAAQQLVIPVASGPVVVPPAPAAPRDERSTLIAEAREIEGSIGDAAFKATCHEHGLDADDLHGADLGAVRGLMDDLRAAKARRSQG